MKEYNPIFNNKIESCDFEPSDAATLETLDKIRQNY